MPPANPKKIPSTFLVRDVEDIPESPRLTSESMTGIQVHWKHGDIKL
jgi:hypothetical protein